MPHMAQVARTASAPLAVRLRRRKQFGKTPAGATDATENGLTPSDKATYDRLKAVGDLNKSETEESYISLKNLRRTRIRGFRTAVREGAHMTDVVGQKVYLPNIVMRLVRNHTPPGQPYNPYEATFRIPQSVTKTDVRSLLLAVYGVRCTYIRTDNYISPWYRTLDGPRRRAYKTYKRAVVGLVEPFYYPQRLEDMEPEARKEREEFIERNFAIQHTRNLQKEELLRLTKGQGRMSWKFKAPYATKRSHIIRLVSERRAARENLVADFASGMRELREEEGKFNYKMLKARVKPPPPSSESVPPPSSDAPSSA
jgi:large subunit ribosomal protein L23